MADRQAVRRELRRQGIVEAAAAVFAEMGIQAATLEQIGAKVGLSKASLYYYVESKEQLMTDVLAGVLREIDARTEALTNPDDPPLERLRARARAHVETAFLSPAGRLIVSNIDTLVETKAAAALLRRHEEPARCLLQDAVESGEAKAIDPTCAVKLLYGALNNITRWYRSDHGSLDTVIDRTWDLFAGGVSAQ